jgi:hypothetical protein
MSSKPGSLSRQRLRGHPISVRAIRDKIELELKKCPDFQLYLLTRSLDDRMRMERLLDQNPRFRLWRVLVGSIARAVDEADLREKSAVSVGEDGLRMSRVNKPVFDDAPIVNPVEVMIA